MLVTLHLSWLERNFRPKRLAYIREVLNTVYPKKYAHGFCFAVLCCGYTLTDFPISIRLISLAMWQFNDCPSASEATLMNMDIYFMWIHYERLHNHNEAKHNKTVWIFLGIYCTMRQHPLPRKKSITEVEVDIYYWKPIYSPGSEQINKPLSAKIKLAQVRT